MTTEETKKLSGKNNHNSIVRIIRYLRNVIIAASIAILLNIFFVESLLVTSGSMENTILTGDFLFVNKIIYGSKTPSKFPILGFDIPVFSFTGLKDPERGEVIVFQNYLQRDQVKGDGLKTYIKRCIGLPGDTVKIRNGIIVVNSSTLNLGEKGKRGDNFIDMQSMLFPEGTSWTSTNYGPIYIPREDDIVILNKFNINLYKTLINREYGAEVVTEKENSIYILDEEVTKYKFRNDYYFMLGDNMNNSADSRYWGFLSADNIIGRAGMIYWSLDFSSQNSNVFNSVRWNRIAKFIN